MQCIQAAGRLQLQQQGNICLAQASQLRQCDAPVSYKSVFFPLSAKYLGRTRIGDVTVLRGNSEAGYEFSQQNRDSTKGGAVEVVSMARERRVKMVSQQIKREISEMLLYDNVIQAAVLPETSLGADMYLTAVATITDVEMSNDLSVQVAKVYVSIFGDERAQNKALEGLKDKAPYVRKLLAQRINLKHTPEVRFFKDEALERGSRVIAILDKLKKEKNSKELEALAAGDYVDDDQEGSTNSQENHGDESDWEDDENITFIK